MKNSGSFDGRDVAQSPHLFGHSGRFGRLLPAQIEQKRRGLGRIAQVGPERFLTLFVDAPRVFHRDLTPGKSVAWRVSTSSISSARTKSTSFWRDAASDGIASIR